MNDFGWDLHEHKDSIDKCTNLLANSLNNGRLSLILGAGASAAFGIPLWDPFVQGCIGDLPAGKVTIDSSIPFDAKDYSTRFFRACKSQAEYIEIVRRNLYKTVTFDFKQIQKKDLLIALTSLIVGKSRGNVRNVITYNFDNILEWYLEINGLRVNVLDKRPLDQIEPDVEILHLHGFLPPNGSKWRSTKEIVFTQEEFNVRERGTSYWRELVDELYKRFLFLTIGLSPESVCKDIIPYLQVLNQQWYKDTNPRRQPYGVAFLTRYTDKQAEDMIYDGIIPCKIEKENTPSAVFGIAQKAVKLRE